MRIFLPLVLLTFLLSPALSASPPDSTVLTQTLRVDTTLSGPVVLDRETLARTLAGQVHLEPAILRPLLRQLGREAEGADAAGEERDVGDGGDAR